MKFKMNRTQALFGVLAVVIIGRTLFSSNTIHPKTPTELSRASVMITNLAGNSGGSGVILHSDSSGSTILTNRHVCHLAITGARLTSGSQTGLVTSFKTSEMHDLCMIKTNKNFGVSTDLASESPNVEDDAIISGFPQLFPHTVTKGQFGNHVTIPIMTDIRPCTPEELSGELGIVCTFLGGIPVIQLYDAGYVSGLIMAGNSGSPVFNRSGEISGLVFAGSSGLSFAFIVPWEYVNAFVNQESKTLEDKFPSMQLNVSALLGASNKNKLNTTKLLEKCENNDVPQRVLTICNQLSKAYID